MSLVKLNPTMYHLSSHMILDGFLGKYFSSQVLAHVIGDNDNHLIPKIGKLFVKFEDDAYCDLPNGIYICHDSPRMLHWNFVHAFELMDKLGHLSSSLDDVLCIVDMDMRLGPLENMEDTILHT
jgi:hypothetical protein